MRLQIATPKPAKKLTGSLGRYHGVWISQDVSLVAMWCLFNADGSRAASRTIMALSLRPSKEYQAALPT
jgi:hypothetical protein